MPAPRSASVTPLLASLLLLIACGGSDGPTEPPPDEPGPPASVAVSPASLTLATGESGQLAATVRDASGRILQTSVSWSSSDAGVATVSSAGSVTAVSPGSTTVTATAGSASGAASVTVENAPPTVSISAPQEGASVEEGDTVTFQGSATDPEDGELSASLVWTSDRDGELGTGAMLAVAELSVGTHAVTASVTDAQGAQGSAQVTLTVVEPASNTAPTAAIDAPAEGATFEPGDTVTFRGSGSDPEDGALTGSSLAWTSSRDGALGTGAEVVRTDLSTGSHVVVLTATDAEGATGTDTVRITVAEPGNAPPQVAITQPADGSRVEAGASVSFQATASDPEDGALSGTSVMWRSDRDGAIGSGLSFSRTDLSVGTHRIVATATDSQGLQASDTVSLTVESVGGGGGSVASLALAPDFLALDQGESVPDTFTVTARDAQGGAVADPEVSWSSSDATRATVNASGGVTGVASGTAEIRAASGSGADTAKVAVAGSGDLVATALASGAWTVEAGAGTTVTLTVALDMSRASANGDLGAAQFELTWNAALLTVESAQVASAFTGAVNTDAPGKATVAVVRTSPVGQAAFTLATLTFRVAAGASVGAGTSLGFAFTEAPTSTSFSTYALPISVASRVRVR